MSVCEACGRKGLWQGHHPTGKNHGDVYLDAEFTVRLCHDHHTLCHDDWYTLGIANAPEGLTRQRAVELRLRRCAATLARIEPDPNALTLRVARFLVDCADDLNQSRG